MNNNLLIVHGGAPTAVLNASLYGVVRETLQHAAIGGVDGIFRERFIDFLRVESSR